MSRSFVRFHAYRHTHITHIRILLADIIHMITNTHMIVEHPSELRFMTNDSFAIRHHRVRRKKSYKKKRETIDIINYDLSPCNNEKKCVFFPVYAFWLVSVLCVSFVVDVQHTRYPALVHCPFRSTQTYSSSR